MSLKCPACGVPQKDGVRFCVECGAGLSEGGTASSPSPKPPPPPPEYPSNPADPTPASKHPPRFGSEEGPKAFSGPRERLAPPDSHAAPVPEVGEMTDAAGVNGLAVFAMVCAVILPPLGVLLGGISLFQISTSKPREAGSVLAIAAMGIGTLITIGAMMLFGALKPD